MPKVHRQNDDTTGHGCWPPTKPADYSPDVYANGLRVVRRGDPIIPHTCPPIPETHGGNYQGSHNVYVNSRDIQVVGDPISCGDNAGQGSPNVYACGG